MFRNFLKIAFRNLTRHKLYSFINIGGLSIGLGACMLILLFVLHEHSHDSFHAHADRIYTTYAKIKLGGDSVQVSGMSYATAPMVQKSSPLVESALRLETSYRKKSVMNPADPGKRFGESNFIFADSNFFRFFSFRLREGNPDQALARPFSLVITAEAAKKYFGQEDPIGKTLRYDSSYTFTITGIADKAPSNSSIHYDFIASLSSQTAMTGEAYATESTGMGFGNYHTFFRLRAGADPRQVEKSMLQIAQQDKGYADAPARYALVSLLSNSFQQGTGDDANGKYLKIFPLVAGLILLLALINYMNLATARATLRAKEVGVRKTSGASRLRIAQQFYIESALYAILAFALGFLLFRLAQPYFYNLIGLTIDPSFIFQPSVLAVFAGLLLVTILIAGTYPSIVLSSYNPVAILYGRMSRERGGAGLRRFLTVLQFSISIILIICSTFIGRQLYFFRHTGTGVDRENVLTVPFTNTMGNHYSAFKKDIQSLAGIKGTATANYVLYTSYNMAEAELEDKKTVAVRTLTVDDQFIPLLNMEWKIPPRDHSIYVQDHRVIINEAALSKLHLPADPIGKQLHFGSPTGYAIAGVVKDFNYASLHSKIEAMCLYVQKDSIGRWGLARNGCLMARIGTGVNLPVLLEEIKKVYEQYDAATPFEYEFLDDAFNSGYQAEDRLAGILDVFTGLTVLIACLGLFGLAAFSATQKTKEIGIRKVMGASVRSLVLLLTKDFIRLVLLSILLAVPVSWYCMHKWLESFAYRISIGWEIFALSGLTAVLIATLTISVEAIRSAIANPVKSLRSE